MDYTFKILGFPTAPVWRAARRAVLRPLFPQAGDPARLDCAQTLLGRLLFEWRRRVFRLGELGWPPGSGRRLQYVRNCAPSLARMLPEQTQPVRSCRLDQVCPWCWARRNVYEAYDRLRAARAAAGPDAVVFYRSIVDPIEADGLAAAAAALPVALRQSWRQLRCHGAAGMLGLGVLEPCPSGWRAHVRLIGLGRAGFAAPGFTAEACGAAAPLRALQRYARYPTGLLRGDDLAMAAALSACQRVRLHTTTGLCYYRRRSPRRLTPLELREHGN